MAENNYITSPEYVEAVKEVFGGRIDLDPCSSPTAQRVVSADRHYGLFGWKDDSGAPIEDGLNADWDIWNLDGNPATRVYVNPPGGTITVPGGRKMSSALLWWLRTWDAYSSREIHSAIFMAFNAETLRLGQRYKAGPLDVANAICIPAKRIAFVNPNTGRVDRQNRFWSALFYLGPEAARFETVFERFGSTRQLRGLP